jgi:hypothetical protein
LSQLGCLPSRIASTISGARQVSSTVEYVRKIKLWDKGKALEQLSRHLGLYHDQVPSEQGRDRPLTDLTDEELYQRLLDARVRLNRAIDHEQGMRCGTRLLESGKPTPPEGS